MENEFSRLNLVCDSAYIIPSGAGYPTELGPNQVCNLFGAQPGQSAVTGSQYIFAGYEYQTKELWRNLGILAVFFVGFGALQVLAMELLAHGQQPLAIAVFAKENADTKKRNAALQEKKDASRRGEIDQDLVRALVLPSRDRSPSALTRGRPFPPPLSPLAVGPHLSPQALHLGGSQVHCPRPRRPPPAARQRASPDPRRCVCPAAAR